MQDYIREVSFRELWYYLLSKWKIFVISFAGVLVLAGAFYAYKANNTVVNQNSDEIDIGILSNLDETDSILVEEIFKKYSEYDQLEKTIENSYVYTMDSYNVYRLQKKYYLDTDYVINYNEDIYSDYSNELIDAYRLFAVDDVIKNRLLNLGIEGLNFMDLDYMISSSTYGKVVSFYYRARSEADCRLISEEVDKYLKENYNLLNETIGKHTFTFINESMNILYDEYIDNAKSNYNNRLSYIMRDINSKLNELPEDVRTEVLRVIEREQEDEQEDEQKNDSITFMSAFMPYVKNICIISVAVVFLVALYFVLAISFTRRIVNIRDVMSIVGSDDCYMVSDTESKSLIRKQLESGGVVYLTQTIAEILAVNLKKRDVSEVIIMTDDYSLAGVENLKNELGKLNISCEAYVSDDKIAQKVNDKSVIFVGRYSRSRVLDMRAQVKVCKMLNARIIGGLLEC